MAQRTTTSLVIERLILDYDAARTPSTQPSIDWATLIMDRVVVCSEAKGIALTAAELEMMERLLAAHSYVQTDQTFASKSTAGASASFHGQTGMHLEGSKYGQMAMDMDYSGCLASINGRNRASASWLGRPRSAQTYTD